jgi:hypothetical protein
MTFFTPRAILSTVATMTGKKRTGRKSLTHRKDSRYQRATVKPAKRLAALLTEVDTQKIISRF